MQIICCVCQKTKSHKGWTKQAAGSRAPHSHGYCPQCYQQILEKVENFFGLTDCRKSA